ncbi:hypothetical protein [Hyphococcus sp.]|uniref:hypothetical protein n=1 Tax=Hyphococcus sp. TaxID=2038636 RepID=UPI0035C6B1F5
MNKAISLLSCVAFFPLAACGGADNTEAGADSPEVSETSTPQAAAECPVIEARNWSAWVNAMPGPDAKPMLHVAGDVDLPTPGYDIAWQEGMADRSATPVQRLMLTLTPPDGMAAQVVTTESVKYEGPALTKTYGGVIVLCGGEALAEIDEVVTAE